MGEEGLVVLHQISRKEGGKVKRKAKAKARANNNSSNLVARTRGRGATGRGFQGRVDMGTLEEVEEVEEAFPAGHGRGSVYS